MTIETVSEVQGQPSKLNVLAMFGRLSKIGRELSPEELDALPINVRAEYEGAKSIEERLSSIDGIADVVLDAFKEVAEQGHDPYASDSFSINDALDSALFAVVGEEPSYVLSPEYMNARKHIVLQIVQGIQSGRLYEDDPTKPRTKALVVALHVGLFGQSPSLMDYVGDMSDRLDILAVLAKTPELDSLYVEQLGGLVYDMSFMSKDNVASTVSGFIENKMPAQQLTNLRLLEDVIRYAAYGAGYPSAEMLPDEICDGLESINTDDMSWMSERTMMTLINHVRVGEDDVDDLADMILEDDKKLASRVRLGGQYEHGFTPTRLAEGLIGARSQYGIIEGIGKLEHGADVVNPSDFISTLRAEGIEASEDDLLMFQELQRPEIKGYIEWQLGGIKLEELTLSAQFQLVRFAGTRSWRDFGRLANESSHRHGETRQLFLEAFLATEFGDDLGDIILEIAEKDATGDVAAGIFDNISEIRSLLNNWGEEVWFNDKGSGFEAYFNGIRRSVEERISEILSPVPDLLGNQAVTADFYKGPKLGTTTEVASAEQIAQDLGVLRLAIAKIVESEKGLYGDNTIRQTDSVARFESADNDVAVSVRTETSVEGEARVAWTVKFSPDEQEQLYGRVLEYTASGKPKNGNLTIRVDLEDTTHSLSLDIGSSDPVQKINHRLASAISAGTQHLATRRGEDAAGRDYHVRAHFDTELAQPERFKEWALWMRHNAEIWKNRRAGKQLGITAVSRAA